MQGQGGRGCSADAGKEVEGAASVRGGRGLRQASGEAVFTSDVELPKNGLAAAPVLSTEALAKIVSVDASAALALPGVVAWVDVKDIPEGGKNVDAACRDTIFADGIVEYRGQRIGLVLAETQVALLSPSRPLLPPSLLSFSSPSGSPGISSLPPERRAGVVCQAATVCQRQRVYAGAGSERASRGLRTGSC